MGCTLCGNGVVNYLEGELCDIAEDPLCAEDCSTCSDPRMVLDESRLPSNDGTTERHGRCSFCGNGALDLGVGEKCDKGSEENCSDDCMSCATGYYPVGDDAGSCFLCGNGVLDLGELCDVGRNVHNCRSDCSGCQNGYVPDGTGDCTMCGNGIVDEGEICDPALTVCNSDCTGCDGEIHVPAMGGGCTRCGNRGLDAGEECDSDPHCAADCSACDDGWIPKYDTLGSCWRCGNGVLDQEDGEKCDGDDNCIECADCRAPYALSRGGACLLCGNGRLDVGEICDAAQPGCASHCQACDDGWEPLIDWGVNPTGLCYLASCSSAQSDTASSGECACE